MIVQGQNVSVAPGTGFAISTQVFNSMPITLVATTGVSGTTFSFTGSGIYVLDYEVSLEGTGSIAIYSGPLTGPLILDTTTVAGSSTATTWIHGRAMISVPITGLALIISPVTATVAVTTSGPAPYYMVRLTILKIA
jgi:hypothetical protein